MTMTITITITAENVPHTINPLDLHGLNDVTKVFDLARNGMTQHKLTLLRKLSPYMAFELEKIEEDLLSKQYRTVRFGIECLNRMIEQHNLRVAELEKQVSRRDAQKRMQLIPAGDPRRPAWLD